MRNEERCNEREGGVILHIYHPFLIDMLGLRKNADMLSVHLSFSASEFSFFSPLAAAEVFIVKVSVCRRQTACGLRVLDFTPAQEGLRIRGC